VNDGKHHLVLYEDGDREDLGRSIELIKAATEEAKPQPKNPLRKSAKLCKDYAKKGNPKPAAAKLAAVENRS
jgi:hypothetical protein